MATIESSDGKSKALVVGGRLQTTAVSIDSAETINGLGGLFYIYSAETPAAANDYFFYMKNNTAYDIGIGEIWATSTVPTKILWEFADGTPTYSGTPTPVTPTQANSGSPAQLAADVNTDPDITGLTTNGVLGFVSCDVAGETCHFFATGTIILAPGRAIVFSREAATGTIDLLIRVGSNVGGEL